MKLSTAKAIIEKAHGWYCPPRSRKDHWYTAENRSACGRYYVLIIPKDEADPTDTSTPTDCKACTAKVAAARETIKSEEEK